MLYAGTRAGSLSSKNFCLISRAVKHSMDPGERLDVPDGQDLQDN